MHAHIFFFTFITLTSAALQILYLDILVNSILGARQKQLHSHIMIIIITNIFETIELGLSQSIFEVVVNHIPIGGQLAYCTPLEPNKRPSTATLEKLTYLEDFSTELQKRDRMMLYSGFHVFSVK